MVDDIQIETQPSGVMMIVLFVMLVQMYDNIMCHYMLTSKQYGMVVGIRDNLISGDKSYSLTGELSNQQDMSVGSWYTHILLCINQLMTTDSYFIANDMTECRTVESTTDVHKIVPMIRQRPLESTSPKSLYMTQDDRTQYDVCI